MAGEQRLHAIPIFRQIPFTVTARSIPPVKSAADRVALRLLWKLNAGIEGSFFERPKQRPEEAFGRLILTGLVERLNDVIFKRRRGTAVHVNLPGVHSIGLFGSATGTVSYTHLRAHETRHDLVCRLL